MNDTEKKMTWEQTVEMLRGDPEKRELIYLCYLDNPLVDAAKRFADSDEWKAVQKFLPQKKGAALDIGAGRGISSYALARDGWKVTALEPDTSPVVGSGAIREFARDSCLEIEISESYGEQLPFGDNAFDLVYLRQVMHHASDLRQFVREIARVLKPGGLFIATREHVISRPEDLEAFLRSHGTNKYHGGENAYPVNVYKNALIAGNLKIVRVLGPLDSPLNYYPMTYDEWRMCCASPFSRIFGNGITLRVWNEKHLPGRCLLSLSARTRGGLDKTPGRLYSFISQKP